MTQSHHRGRRPGPGRPRHIERPGAPTERARDEVLDASARLFTDQGYAKTSTREIADLVGIRQASLYYHFPSGKPEILREVLAQTIRPTLANIDHVQAVTNDPATSLYLLVLLDVRTLVEAPHNSGLLGLLPDVAKEVPEFADEHRQLSAAYAALGLRVATARVCEEVPAPLLGNILIANVENAISWQADGTYNHGAPDVIAAGCLRLCGVPESIIEAAREAAHELLPGVAEDVA